MSLAPFTLGGPVPVWVPQPKRWTVPEFHEIRGKPWMESRWMILVEGELLEMPAPNPPHNTSLGLTEAVLRLAFGPTFWIRGQMSLVLGLATDPVPDIAVVPGSPRDYTDHPRTAALVVEIAESSLSYDLREKSSLYAAGRIPEYWVVDLVHRQLVTFRDPVADPAQVFGGRYEKKVIYQENEVASPAASSQATIAVAACSPSRFRR